MFNRDVYKKWLCVIFTVYDIQQRLTFWKDIRERGYYEQQRTIYAHLAVQDQH